MTTALAMALAMPYRGALFDPLSLFVAGAQGGWYDPSDLSTLFQDAAGTTPVTALGQPVGRINDKSGRGNHLTQATAASRPVLSARKNLATSTESLSTSAPWSAFNYTITNNAIVAPNGTQTAARIVATAMPAATAYAVGAIGDTKATFSVYVKKDNRTIVNFLIRNETAAINLTDGQLDFNTGVIGGGWTATAVGGGWWRVSVTVTSGFAATDSMLFYYGATGAVAEGLGWYVWGIQVEQGTALTTYQRVNTATDYDSAGFPHYLAFDGVDDFLTAGTFNMSASDKVTVCAGLRKISATTAVAVELSAASTTNNGAFGIFAPDSAAQYTFASRGTLLAAASTVDAQFAAPHTGVVTGTGDIAADGCRLAIGGIQRGITGSDQGTGNYGAAYPLFVGRRDGTTLPFNGNLYGLVIRGGASTAPQIASLERYMAQKTGIPA